MSNDRVMAGIVGMAFLVVFFLVRCRPVPETAARDAVTSEGLTNVSLGGSVPVFSGCGENQSMMTRSFSARRGTHPVQGVVCCNLFACSIRYSGGGW